MRWDMILCAVGAWATYMNRLWIVLAFLVISPPRQIPNPPDTIFFNGHFVTVNPASPTAQAVAVSNGRFTAVGTNDAVRKLGGAKTRMVDLHERTVLPGLADDHFHSIGGGPGVDLSRARTIDDVLSAIRQRTAKTPAGEVIVTNSDWHEGQLKEQRLPYRKDLDRAAPAHPLVVVRGGHEYILNSAALEKWKITMYS